MENLKKIKRRMNKYLMWNKDKENIGGDNLTNLDLIYFEREPNET